MTALALRAIEPGDLERWLPLWTGYNRFYQRVLPAEITEHTWSRFFDPAEPVHAIVAARGSALVGLAHYIFHRSTTMIAPTCYLQDLFTDEAARGGGVGRALIEAVYDRARAAGGERVYWQTHETNAVAMRLYDRIAEKSGFVVYRKQL